MSRVDKGNPAAPKVKGQQWEALADLLRQTEDTDKARELVMLLEKAIFNRQQELALNGNKREIEQEERRLKKALDLMLEVKTRKLGFPEIR